MITVVHKPLKYGNRLNNLTVPFIVKNNYSIYLVYGKPKEYYDNEADAIVLKALYGSENEMNNSAGTIIKKLNLDLVELLPYEDEIILKNRKE